MMAKRVPSILPSLTLAEALETTQIYSIAGKVERNVSLISQRPFRSPHHTISDIALIGGGTNLQPGEISLAHNGVLFLDELPEYSRAALETMRQPLEDRVISISRAKYSATQPCSFMLVAASNPCPCGYWGEGDRCTCTPTQRQSYLSKLSGPILDRIDLHVWMHPVPADRIVRAQKAEGSAAVAARVLQARQRQKQRLEGSGAATNAAMDIKQTERFCPLDEDCRKTLENLMVKMGFSMRAYFRIIKVARTIADLEGARDISPAHLLEAASYRFLDRQSLLDLG